MSAEEDNDLPEGFEISEDDFDVEMIERVIEHPCEDVFDIESGTTVMTVPAPRQTQLVRAEIYDDKDAEIEEQYQEIYDKAMDAFDDIQNDMEGIEGKYKARNNEVGVAFLNAALSAAKEKARLKEHKDKHTDQMGDGEGGGTGNTYNTQVNISTSDLIKQFAEQENPSNNYIPDAEIVEEVEEVEADEEQPKTSRTKIKRKSKTE